MPWEREVLVRTAEVVKGRRGQEMRVLKPEGDAEFTEGTAERPGPRGSLSAGVSREDSGIWSQSDLGLMPRFTIYYEQI